MCGGEHIQQQNINVLIYVKKFVVEMGNFKWSRCQTVANRIIVPIFKPCHDWQVRFWLWKENKKTTFACKNIWPLLGLTSCVCALTPPPPFYQLPLPPYRSFIRSSSSSIAIIFSHLSGASPSLILRFLARAIKTGKGAKYSDDCPQL